MSSSLRRLIVASTSTVVLMLSIGVSASSVEAAPKPKSYTSCAQLQKDYPHGVARSGAKDKVGAKAKPVTNFTVSTTVYGLNDGPRNKKTGEYDLDRDNDGVACERR